MRTLRARLGVGKYATGSSVARRFSARAWLRQSHAHETTLYRPGLPQSLVKGSEPDAGLPAPHMAALRTPERRLHVRLPSAHAGLPAWCLCTFWAKTTARAMNDDVCFDLLDPVPDVLTKLLLDVLPPELQPSTRDLVNCIAEHPHVAPNLNKLWMQLSEAEGDAIARESGVVAGIVIRGGAPVLMSGGIRTDPQSASGQAFSAADIQHAADIPPLAQIDSIA